MRDVKKVKYEYLLIQYVIIQTEPWAYVTSITIRLHVIAVKTNASVPSLLECLNTLLQECGDKWHEPLLHLGNINVICLEPFDK